jgi:rhodanese-related sulfurtransferase
VLPLACFAAFIQPEAVDGFTAEEIAIYLGTGIVLVGVIIFLVGKIQAMPHEARAKLSPTMDPMQVEELMHGPAPIIVDLRPVEEFNGKLGHLRGARNIPLPALKQRIDELRGTTGNRPVILVDTTDKLSHLAAPILRSEGFEWFYVLKGGMKAWTAEKLPVYR